VLPSAGDPLSTYPPATTSPSSAAMAGVASSFLGTRRGTFSYFGATSGIRKATPDVPGIGVIEVRIAEERDDEDLDTEHGGDLGMGTATGVRRGQDAAMCIFFCCRVCIFLFCR
jgi:hypothetical protein